MHGIRVRSTAGSAAESTLLPQTLASRLEIKKSTGVTTASYDALVVLERAE